MKFLYNVGSLVIFAVVIYVASFNGFSVGDCVFIAAMVIVGITCGRLW